MVFSHCYRCPCLVSLVLFFLCAPHFCFSANVLILMPSVAYLRLQGGSQVRVGSYLDETMYPVTALMDAGHQFAVATPEGNPPILDPRSCNVSYFVNASDQQRALKLWNTLPAFQDPWRIRDLAPENVLSNTTCANSSSPSQPLPWNVSTAVDERVLSTFDALFIPGGHAPMIDLWPSDAVARIILYFVDTKKLIVSICHGPTVLASTSIFRAPWPFANINMTVFSTEAEKINEARWGAKMGFYPEDVLRNLGGNVIQKPAFTPHVIYNSRLLTGQNPQSAPQLAEMFMKKLAEHQRSG